MTPATEKKPTITNDKKITSTETLPPPADAMQSSTTTAPEKTTTENLREAIKALDAERTELVKNTIENIKPGKPFDSSVVREINSFI